MFIIECQQLEECCQGRAGEREIVVREDDDCFYNELGKRFCKKCYKKLEEM